MVRDEVQRKQAHNSRWYMEMGAIASENLVFFGKGGKVSLV